MFYKTTIIPADNERILALKSNQSESFKAIEYEDIRRAYKSTFKKSLNAYNDVVLSTHAIDNYYNLIKESNIPEAYELTVSVYYDISGKEDAILLKKYVALFCKEFKGLSELVKTAVFRNDINNLAEIKIFFFAAVDGYPTGLSCRNDVIDATKHLVETEEDLNALQALSRLNDYFSSLWKSCSEGMSSEADLEAERRKREMDVDDNEVHNLAAGQLKQQINDLHYLSSENVRLDGLVREEAERVRRDVDLIPVIEEKIREAEEERVRKLKEIEEQNRIEELLRIEALNLAKEEARKEEERRKKEVELGNTLEEIRMMTGKSEEAEREMREAIREVAENPRTFISQSDFKKLVQSHLKWMKDNGINAETDIEKLSEGVLESPARLKLSGMVLKKFKVDGNTLCGAVFDNCMFLDSKVLCNLSGTEISKCKFINTEVGPCVLLNCSVSGCSFDGNKIHDVVLKKSALQDCSFQQATLDNCELEAGGKVFNCDFYNGEIKSADMKKTEFVSCVFENADFSNCDLRMAVFRKCKMDTVKMSACATSRMLTEK